jgi:hypothetical protein
MAVGSIPAQTSNVLSLCDVLANPQKHNGHLVMIRAALVPSLNDTTFDELAPLESDRCYRPRRQQGLRIGIGGSYMPSPPENFKPDVDSYEWADKSIDDIVAKDPRTRRLVVTVEGIVYDGGPEPSGVTRHPWYPAVMLISSWKDIWKP